MLRFLQKLTKYLSIKSIVILGVLIMGIIIIAFGLTMTYLSSTIKYDQTTLKHILALEKQNQSVLSTIKDVNYINNKILISKNLKKLELLEKKLLTNVSFQSMSGENRKNIYVEDYNNKIKALSDVFNRIIILQKNIYNSKNTILYYTFELSSYKNKIDGYTNIIGIETESIYGKASLLTKRYNRKLKKPGKFNVMYIVNNKMIVDLGRVMTISTDLDSSILKLPAFIYNIISTENEDIINSIEKNNLTQLILLFEDSLTKLEELQYLEKTFKPTVELINSKFSDTMGELSFLIILKKQLLKEEVHLSNLLNENDTLNGNILTRIEELNNISNNIKLDILNHSNAISKKTTMTIIVVGIVCLLLLILAASTLISRINLPLEFIIKFMDSIINKKRELSSKLPIITNDEFGKLSNSFNQMTSTIDNNIHEIKHLTKEIEDTQKEVIFTMGAIGESRSKETGNHVKRVAEYSKILALKYGIEPEIAELLREASPMHDIGKVGIPDSVLKKPAKLSDDEWKVMQTHAELGYDMLKHSHRDILQAASTVAYEHHEKWDGTGYPRGLKGDKIHIFGRITAIADVFDALGSDRCYKKAWALEDIKDYFQKNRGTHFDPKLVDIFFDNLDEFLYVRDKYKDTFE